MKNREERNGVLVTTMNVTHGTLNAWTNYGCRCAPCRTNAYEARNAHDNQRNKNRGKRGPKDMVMKGVKNELGSVGMTVRTPTEKPKEGEEKEEYLPCLYCPRKFRKQTRYEEHVKNAHSTRRKESGENDGP